jgi:CrcB protein
VSGLYAVVAIGLGSMVGALLRYGLSLGLNAVLPPIPMGTLASNWVAAYIVGATIAFLAAAPSLSPNWRLFLITGLAGGLSTFSTFSAELLTLLRDGRWGWSAGMLGLHVCGSLAMVMLGMATVSWIRQSS